MNLAAPLYIDTERSLRQWVAHAESAPLVAVDTESDSFHRYREKVCLVQMTAAGLDAIIDPLAIGDLSPLKPLFEDPTKIKIFHDACYDIICLHRDYGFRLRGLFDTMLASRLLGQRHFGLASLLRAHFGFEADKRLQRSDWAQRPLSPAQLAYAQADTHFLPELVERLSAELRAAGRLAWATEDFARLPAACERMGGREPQADPLAFWRVTGARNLTPIGRGRLRALHGARERIAARLDRPAFKVMGDALLLELAAAAPDDPALLAPRPGLRRGGIGRFGPEIMAALATATPIAEGPPAGAGRRRRSGRLQDPEARARYEALRELRRTVADGLGLEPEVTLGNAFLEDLARTPPRDRTELAARAELIGWRAPHLVDPIMHLLSHPLPPPSPRRGRGSEDDPPDEV